MSFLKESWLKRGDDLALEGKGPQNCPLEAVSQLSGVMSRGRLVLCLTVLDSLYLVLISVGVSIMFSFCFCHFSLYPASSVAIRETAILHCFQMKVYIQQYAQCMM